MFENRKENVIEKRNILNVVGKYCKTILANIEMFCYILACTRRSNPGLQLAPDTSDTLARVSPGVQISAGHRTLSGQILHFVRSKLFMTGHVTDRFRLVKSPISKNVYLTHFLLMKPTRKQHRQHFSTISCSCIKPYDLIINLHHLRI